MANPEHLALLKQGVDAWDKWRHANSNIEADLNKADLHGAALGRANLDETSLSEALLRETILSNINLTRTEGLDTTATRGHPSLF